MYFQNFVLGCTFELKMSFVYWKGKNLLIFRNLTLLENLMCMELALFNIFLNLTFSDKWSPALQIRTVLLSIQALLSAPNPDDPLANDVAELWKVNEVEAIRNAREWTRTYAMGNI